MDEIVRLIERLRKAAVAYGYATDPQPGIPEWEAMSEAEATLTKAIEGALAEEYSEGYDRGYSAGSWWDAD